MSFVSLHLHWVNQAHDDAHEEQQQSSSLFSSTEGEQPPAPAPAASITADPDPSKPAHFLGNTPTSDSGSGNHSSQYDANKNKSQSIEQGSASAWTSEDIVLVVVLPIVLTILFGFSLRHCWVVNKRHGEFHERRQSLRAAERAQTREERRVREKKRKERLKEIEKVLISKTASECKCNISSSSSAKIKSIISMSDLTMHTNITDDMDDLSQSSSRSHDEENPPLKNDVNANAASTSSELGEEASTCAQTCAICLDSFAAKDKVSWSKYQTCCHAFHSKCIEGWLAETKHMNGNCPICRGPYLKLKTDANDISIHEDVQTENGESYVDVDVDERPVDIANNANAQNPGGQRSDDTDQGLVDSNNNDVGTADEENNVVGLVAEVCVEDMTIVPTSMSGDTSNVHVQTSDGENNAQEATSEPITTLQVPDEENNIMAQSAEAQGEGLAVPRTSFSAPGENVPTIETLNAAPDTVKVVTMGSEFTIFCIVHGLKKKK